ncbi:hypothetical protein TNCT_521841 [Trichonephila clavata]|uniref:Uncharacterized protein n=1 Tax=Trichonephila clavata TaxID=2740835 RepID=A0A8X6GHJ5_TRICU|nr:hypothetical protein TNCT_521841 [Trichonephila clavata]
MSLCTTRHCEESQGEEKCSIGEGEGTTPVSSFPYLLILFPALRLAPAMSRYSTLLPQRRDRIWRSSEGVGIYE